MPDVLKLEFSWIESISLVFVVLVNKLFTLAVVDHLVHSEWKNIKMCKYVSDECNMRKASNIKIIAYFWKK